MSDVKYHMTLNTVFSVATVLRLDEIVALARITLELVIFGRSIIGCGA